MQVQNDVVLNESSSLLKVSSGDDHHVVENLEESLHKLYRARRILYFSHCFAQAAEISWQFCLTMFLAAFTDYSSLFLVSSYGLLSGLAILFTGGKIGSLVDSSARLSLAQSLLVIQNSCVVLATICCFLLLSHKPHYYDAENVRGESNYVKAWLTSRLHGIPVDGFSICCLIFVHICGVIADSLDKAFKVAMEKDWIVVMSSHAAKHGVEKSSFLRETNVTMKQIDLSCKVVAPVLAGFLLVYSDLRYSAIGIGVVNILSIVVEFGCTDAIYRCIPGLSSKNFMSNSNDQNRKYINVVISENNEVCHKRKNGLQSYFEQPIAAGGFALSLL